MKKREVEVGKRCDQGSRGIQIFGVHLLKKWKNRSASEGERKEKSKRGHKGNMKDRKEVVWGRRKSKKGCGFLMRRCKRHVLRSESMGLKRKREDGGGMKVQERYKR